MTRGPLYESNYKPQFSGHETFPLRYGWLKKAYDAVAATEKCADNKGVFRDDDAIARFGVGKNMVASMRHWANAANIIQEPAGGNAITTTDFGRKLFADDGLDPYMEHPATLWLVHWNIASCAPTKTTWYWAFSHYHSTTFDREHLVQGIERLAEDRGWTRASVTTIKRDVECFVRTYTAAPSGVNTNPEDALESPLTELGLLKPMSKKDGFRFVRGAKSTLDAGAFLYALTKFWLAFSSARTLSYENIAHAPGSPGRLFLLDEARLGERLSELDELSDGIFKWSETAGLKQLIRNQDLTVELALSFIDRSYSRHSKQEAA